MKIVGEILFERGERYGNYLEQTAISNKIKGAIQGVPAYWSMESDQKDALDMIAVKMSRIVNGDPDYADNWADIAGYATLVKDRLEGNECEQHNYRGYDTRGEAGSYREGNENRSC